MSVLSIAKPPAGSSRSKPVATVGEVNVLAPTGSSAYYRLTWTNPDGTAGRTSGGRTQPDAEAKASALNVMPARAAGGKAMTPLLEVAEDYLSSRAGRNAKTGGDWDASQLKQMKPKVARCLRGHTTRTAMEVDRKLLDLMRSQAGTRRTRRENATTLRGFLRWGATQGYFSAEQAELAELLPVRVYDPVGEVAGTEAPKRRTRVRNVGESEIYISGEDAPGGLQIVALADQLELAFPAWGRLAPELAADAGPRWAELFQLVAGDVVATQAVLSKRGKVKQPAMVHLRIDWHIDRGADAGQDRRKPPKGKKRRKSGVSEVSITGFRLHEALLARRAAALREQAEGTNPEALLFPAPDGGLWHHIAFSNDVFKPAAPAAGWPHQTWTYVGQRWNVAAVTVQAAVGHSAQGPARGRPTRGRRAVRSSSASRRCAG